MATIKQVAKRANVSVATVSRVINNNAPVQAHLRARVEEAIKDLDYRPSGIARNMRNQSLRAIGVITADILNPFFTKIVRSIEEEVYQEGYSVILCNTNEDPEKELMHIEFLQNERVAGVIWAPVGNVNDVQLNGIPTVIIDRHKQGQAVDSVVVNNVSGLRQAVKHLAELGHQRIGYISGPIETSTGIERLEGYKLELANCSLEFEPGLVVPGDYREAGGMHAMRQLLSLPTPPSAVIAANNLMTIGALLVLHEERIRIPEQMSVIGFDDMPWYSLISTPLTVVKQPLDEIGHMATDLLLRRIKNDRVDFPLEISLQPQLIVRASTSYPSPTA